MASKLNKSWERERSEIHSPDGVADLRKELKWALVRKYTGIAESMWEYDFGDDETSKFADFKLMSFDLEPERTMMRNGKGVWFNIPSTDQWAFLPLVYNSEINIFGNPVGWSPIPVGYNDTTDRGKSPIRDKIRDLKLDATNSVIMRDNIYGESDYAIINKACDALVDDMLTVNQLTLLAKSPYIFNVGPDNILDAKNYFKALAEDKPAIFRYNDVGEQMTITEQTPATIDPALFDVYRHWEDILLEQLGIPGAQRSEKRAQETISEVMLSEDMVSMRRKEKHKFRQMAIDRLNKMAGTNVILHNVIDELIDEQNEMEDQNDEKTVEEESHE